MANNLARLFLRVEGDTSRVGPELRALEQRADQSSRKVETSFNRTGQSLLVLGRRFAAFGAAGAAAFGAIGFAAVEAAGEVAEIESKFNAVFRSQAAATEAWAEAFARDVGRSKFELLGFLAQLQDTFVPLGFARDRAADLSKQLTALAVDVASFNNEAEASVIQAFTSALVGNHEAVRRFGILITQATLEQELLNQGIDGGVKEATELEKVLARLNIIMKSTTDAQGDAARTADSYVNKKRALAAAVRDLNVAIGKLLLDGTPLVDWLGELATKAGLAAALVQQLRGTLKFDSETEEIAALAREADNLRDRLALIASIAENAPAGGALEWLLGTDEDRRRLREIREQIEALRQAQERRFGSGSSGAAGEPASPPPPPSADPDFMKDTEKAIADAKKERKAALDFLDDMKRSRMQAAGETMALIERERQADLARLEDLRLTESEMATARVEINRRAAAEVAEVVKRQNEEIKKSLEDTGKAGEKAMDAIGDASRQASAEVSRGLVGALRGAEGQIIDLMGVLDRLLARVLDEAIFGPLADVAVAGLRSAFTFSEQGNVFSGGRVVPFASGGVIDRPVSFPLRGGTGIAGEAGPEAIVPLMRTSGGDLGVRATVAAAPVRITVINNAGVAVEAREFQDGAGGRSIEIAVNQMVAEGVRRGGPVWQAFRDMAGARVTPARR